MKVKRVCQVVYPTSKGVRLPRSTSCMEARSLLGRVLQVEQRLW